MGRASDDPPPVAAEIAAMTAAWNKRLVMACLTMSAILAFFAFDMRDAPDFAAQLMLIAPWFLGLILACFVATRFAMAHQEKQIRQKFAGRDGGRS